MLPRAGPGTVLSRLLGPLALVVAPAALLISVLAYSLFGEVLANMRATQVSAAAVSARSVQSWFDAAGRSLANEADAVSFVDAPRCSQIAEAFLRRNPGFSAVQFVLGTAPACSAGAPIEADRPPLEAAGAELDESGYRVFDFGARVWIVAGSPDGPKKISGLLIVDEATLQDRLQSDTAFGETQVALLNEAGKVISADPRRVQASWLPSTLSPAASEPVWRCPDKTGAVASFALAPVKGSGFRVLMRFADSKLQAARWRLVVLCLAELAMLGLLAYVYAATIRRNVVTWIHGIDATVRDWGADTDSPARVPVSANMPRELRNVAESFNAMADGAVAREQKLSVSLAENRALMLEMHHRIKNSLQVIQSYLALIRRTAARPEALLLSRIEARVGVLAIAYRLALTPGGLRPIAVKPFLDEICAAAIGGLRRPRQRVAYEIGWEGELVVDRAIPLGLGLVEALIAALSAAEASYVGVGLTAEAGGDVELRVESDAAPAETGLPDRVMRGLAGQLGATASPGVGGEILVWKFRP